MNLDEFVEKYGLLQDEGGRYYWIDEKKKRREPYCTMLALSLMLNISVPAIKKRIKNLRQTFVKNYRHRIVNAYNLNEVIALCSDLLKESMDGTLFVTNKNGIAIVGSKKYTYLKKLAKLFNVSQSLLEKCVKDKNLPFIMAKIPGGRIIEAYEIRAVEKNCIEIITLPNTNDQGVAIIDGEGYTTIYALTKILNLHYSVIKKFITDNDIESKKIRVAKGQVREGYSIKKVKKACRERRKDHPIVNAQGFAFIDGEKYANITTLSREIKIDLRVLSLRVKKKQLKPIKIRRTASCLDDGYHVKAVEKICGDLLIEYPLVDSSGIAIIDGEKYTTISKLTTILSCSQSKVEEII